MAPSPPTGDGNMKRRAILIALGTGVVISSAAALDIAGAREDAQPAAAQDDDDLAGADEADDSDEGDGDDE